MGITSIEMNVGNVKDTDRRSFDLTTPYRIFRYCTNYLMVKSLNAVDIFSTLCYVNVDVITSL